MRSPCGDLAIANVGSPQEFHYDILHCRNRKRLMRNVVDFKHCCAGQSGSNVSCILDGICGIERSSDEQ